MRASLHQAGGFPGGGGDAQRPVFPSTRYQGSKAKLAEWIWSQLADLDFHTCLDCFGGTGVIAYRLKQAGKRVTYNDALRFNHLIGSALIQNSRTTLSAEETDWLLARHPSLTYPTFVQDTFGGVYFTDTENAWIDQTITNIRALPEEEKQALAFFALCQACIVKRPYNLFHRRNLYLRFAQVARHFGNKASWDRPFDDWFRVFVGEGNRAVLDNGQDNRAVNHDAADVPGDFDLVYIDPPYMPVRGAGVDYRDFYHFLEGLASYDRWAQQVDRGSRHRRLLRQPNPWNDRGQIHTAFDNLFRRYKDSILVVSYRGDGVPGADELVRMLSRYKEHVRVASYGAYKYALSRNAASCEILLIGV
ncbi:MAG: DNA adenine methylase [Chloroflexi bacterium]|nr:DNA adenine methylase [Chloroflexota bacterium]MCL5274353.1 DNA adenine methylase [Chloroflexota bacterium]